MAGKRGRFYAVQNGRQQGVYNNWDDCKEQVTGYSGARYKKFDTYAEAQAFSNSQVSAGTERNFSSQRSSASDPRNCRDYAAISYASHQTHSWQPTRQKKSYSVKKYYSVKSSNPSVPSRIFSDWKECERYVKGQKGLSFKKFEDQDTAVQFMKGTADDQVDFSHAGISKNEFTARYKLSPTNRKYSGTSRVYCDGSALANGTSSSCAGYGVHFADEPGNDISEPLRSGAQTNNRAEIQAVSRALDEIWHNLTENNDKKCYQIKTDSEYVAKLLNDRYFAYTNDELAGLPNSDLINPLLEKFTKVKQYYAVNHEAFDNNGRFTIEWVKGHAGEPGNEIADELARRGALKKT
ncbi:hypothetical protein HG536_0D01420 [Torulaspora globosa]|uniref:Ribonuclease H n=1 Tax=Torulaspora globosa TaxID=48254 RepID=A0A7G3ZGI4_9SACH|nr:uncharacterized protein HG536_0D01420 [Torulaspora globosa]QLL32620.1 hypothetical protein HG536_0D01420 [Torulaspora globosa]